MVCGNCKREMHGERISCLYCGWTKTEGLAAPTAAKPVAGSEDPRTFRAGATTWRFLIWALATSSTGILILKHGPVGGYLSNPALHFGIPSVLFVLGPLAFGAQLLRTVLVRVTIDPKAGLILRGGQIVSWDEIETVQYTGLRLLGGQEVIVFLLDVVRLLSTRVPVYGLWGGVMGLLRIGLIAIIGGSIAIVALLSGVLLPVSLLLSPWEPRVLVHTKTGPPLVWRDLRNEADFIHGIEAGLRQARSATQIDDIK